MATQAAHVRRKHEGDKSEKNSESKETPEAQIPPLIRQQRSSRTNNSLKGKVKKNEGPFLTDNENFNETSALSNIKESTAIDFIPPVVNKSTDEIGGQHVINDSIVNNTLPVINDGNFLPVAGLTGFADFSKVTHPAGNNITNTQGYNTSYYASAADNGVVLNIGPADSSKGTYPYGNYTSLSTQEAIAQYNGTGNPQEITRVTLSSVHKVEGNKELAPKAVSSYTHNFITSENIIEKTISHTDTSVFDVPIAPINMVNKPDDNTIIQAGLNEETLLNNERARSFACEGSSSNTHLVRAAGPSEIPSKSLPNPQPIAENRSSTKGSGRGRPKKAVTKSNIAEGASTVTKAGRGRPKKVKPNETLAGTVEGITTDVKSSESESSKKTQGDLPEVEGISVAAVDENVTKVKHGKRGRPHKIVQAGELVTNPTDGTISESTGVPKKRGRPRKDATNNGESSGKTSKRGRPRKVPKVESNLPKDSIVPTKHNGRGRPRKVPKQTEETRSESTAVVKKRGRPRKVVSESSELDKVLEGSEPKEAPENIKPNDASENIDPESKDVPESIELKDAPQSIDPKDVPEEGGPKDKPIGATVNVKTETVKRGRPKKIPITEGSSAGPAKEPTVSKKRGRPKKETSENSEPKATNVKTNKRGRPRKKQKADDEPSASSNEAGAASESVEYQPATGNNDNALTVSAIGVGVVNTTADQVPISGVEENPEESVDELIDELTTAANELTAVDN